MEKYTKKRCELCNAPLVTNGIVTWCVRKNCKNNKPYFCGCTNSNLA